MAMMEYPAHLYRMDKLPVVGKNFGEQARFQVATDVGNHYYHYNTIMAPFVLVYRGSGRRDLR